MANLLGEYLALNLSIIGLKQELASLQKKYFARTGRNLFIYAADFNKGKTADVSLTQEDFYIVQNILCGDRDKKIDVYLETPGGSGEAAEEIAKFLHSTFEEVNFVIAGEAKSAGTILALAGDNIYMNATGSLGPIDAQVKIGRYTVSAFDYKTWVDEKKNEAASNGKLNPFDAIMVAQISPGEIYGVINSLQYAADLVKDWLPKYKFKNWAKTQTRGIEVTAEMKATRAKEITDKLCNHMEWHTHGRSLKIEDLSSELLIENIDNDPQLSDIVNRIKTIILLIFSSSTDYKIFFWKETQMARTANVTAPAASAVMPIPLPLPQRRQNAPQPVQNIETVDVNITCPKCKKQHVVRGYVERDGLDIANLQLPSDKRIDSNCILTCDNMGCGFSIDLKPVKNQIESQIKKKILFK